MAEITFKPADIAIHTSSIGALQTSNTNLSSSVTAMDSTVTALSGTVSVLDLTAIKSSTVSGEEKITNIRYDTAAEQLKFTSSTA